MQLNSCLLRYCWKMPPFEPIQLTIKEVILSQITWTLNLNWGGYRAILRILRIRVKSGLGLHLLVQHGELFLDATLNCHDIFWKVPELFWEHFWKKCLKIPQISIIWTVEGPLRGRPFGRGSPGPIIRWHWMDDVPLP